MTIENGIITWREPDAKYDYLFDIPKGKHNTNIRLNPDDVGSVKIYCKEPYAQSLYDFMTNSSNYSTTISKDLVIGDVYDVIPLTYDVNEKLIYCEEKITKGTVYVPLSECKNDQFDSTKTQKSFKIVLTQNRNGSMYGSVKKYQKLSSFDTLNEFLANNTIFEVTVTDLIKGGFIVKYDDAVECFLPGAHAAANIIHDFNSYIGKTIKVMVDNFDSASKLFVVSHKKYIKFDLPNQIKHLTFNKQYSGVLTSKPTKFGLFVEFNEIFTGLIHMAEFDNYDNYCKTIKQGDIIDFYVKSVQYKPVVIDGKDDLQLRIILTTKLSNVDPINLTWSEYKDKLEGKEFNYSYDIDKSLLTIMDYNTESVSITVPHSAIKDKVFKKSLVKILDVDVINKTIGFDFI